MAYDEGLAQRIRESLRDQPDLSEIQMFGGIGFMAQGNMVCGVLNDSLIVRVGPERYPEALARPHTREFDFTGRPMAGWVTVGLEGYEADASGQAVFTTTETVHGRLKFSFCVDDVALADYTYDSSADVETCDPN